MKIIFPSFILIASILPIEIGVAQESTPKVIKVSQEKFENAVIKALVQNKAELHGIVACQSRCGSEPDEAGETDYDEKKDLYYTYKIPTSKSGGLVAIITAEKPPIYLHKYFVLPLPNCRSFLTKLRAERKPVSVGRAPNELKIEYGLMSLGNNKLDLMESLCDIKNNEGFGENRHFEIQSIVGHIVNVAQYFSDASEGISRPSGWQNWMSWNFEENRSAELTDLFEKESVLAALKADKVMRQRFFKGRKRQLEQATELSSFMKAIEADPRQSGKRMRWQILSYDPKTHFANVHMGFYGDCCNSHKVFKMGLKLKVREEFLELFQSSLKNGWINMIAENGKKKETNFERAFSNYVDLSVTAKE